MKTNVLKRLAKNESSAHHTYQNLMARVHENRDQSLIEKLAKDHERASHLLSEKISSQAEAAESNGEGSWENLSLIIETSGNPLWDPMVLQALSVGEEQCELDYRQALRCEDLDAETKNLVVSELIPAIKTHQENLSARLHEIYRA